MKRHNSATEKKSTRSPGLQISRGAAGEKVKQNIKKIAKGPSVRLVLAFYTWQEGASSDVLEPRKVPQEKRKKEGVEQNEPNDANRGEKKGRLRPTLNQNSSD